MPSLSGSGNACRITLNPSPDWCGNAATIRSQKSSSPSRLITVNARYAGCWPAMTGLLSVRWWSVLVGAHDREHARRLRWIGRVFRSAVHVRGVVVHFEEVPLPGEFEVAEIVLAVRIIVLREL